MLNWAVRTERDAPTRIRGPTGSLSASMNETLPGPWFSLDRASVKRQAKSKRRIYIVFSSLPIVVSPLDPLIERWHECTTGFRRGSSAGRWTDLPRGKHGPQDRRHGEDVEMFPTFYRLEAVRKGQLQHDQRTDLNPAERDARADD